MKKNETKKRRRSNSHQDTNCIAPVPLTNACQAMQYLNARYCKRSQIDRKVRSSIYKKLKAPLVQWLYKNGYCIETTKSEVNTTCYWCSGTGTDVAYRTQCRSCNGTGIFRKAGLGNSVIGFRFRIEGINYGWHLPEALVRFEISPDTVRSPANDAADAPVTGVEYSAAEAINLVRRFLNNPDFQRAA